MRRSAQSEDEMQRRLVEVDGKLQLDGQADVQKGTKMLMTVPGSAVCYVLSCVQASPTDRSAVFRTDATRSPNPHGPRGRPTADW
jgi:hypothetical protein